jgi:hypothetical protein
MDAGYERAVYYESPWEEGVVSHGRKVLLSPQQISLNILPELFSIINLTLFYTPFGCTHSPAAKFIRQN